MLILSSNKKNASIFLNSTILKEHGTCQKIDNIHLLFPKGSSARKTGLLNHFSLELDAGIIYRNKYIFHTFGMKFPIGVLCFDNTNNLFCKPKIVLQNRIFVVPIGTKYVVEINHLIVPHIYFESNKLLENNKIKIFHHKILKFVMNTRVFFIIITILFCLFLVFSSYSQENLRLLLGKEKTIDLGSAPQSIQISDPDILDVQRIGVTNSVKLIPKQNGKVIVTISYPDGIENNWNIHVGKNDNSLNRKMGIFEQDSYVNSQNSSLNIVSHTLNDIHGIQSQIKNGKIIILGNIRSLQEFRKLVSVVTARPHLFFPVYSISKEIENIVLKSVQSDLKLFGERDLSIINRGGLYTLTGVPSSPTGKHRSWLYLSALIPNIVDFTSNMNGDSTIVQINLEFLEVGKSERIGVGFQQPGMNRSITGTLNFSPSLLSSGITQPTLQIAPLTSLLKALQEKSFARNLAKPVVITRSGEKASFLAGGEVPIVSSSSTLNTQNSSVTFKPFGILFNVTPVVQTDGSI